MQPDRVLLGAEAPDGLELVVGHLNGPTGPVSTLGYHEYVVRPAISFSVWVVRDLITAAQWADVWVLAQEIGLGALRSQGHGRFQLTAWEHGSLTQCAQVTPPPAVPGRPHRQPISAPRCASRAYSF